MLLLAVLFGVAGAVAVSAATPAQVARADRRAAASAADQLLGELALPRGATEVPTEPVGDAHQLARSIELFFFAAEVDEHTFWTTTASPRATLASIHAHLPAGARSVGSGFSGTLVFASYSLPTVDPAALGPRALAVDAVRLANGSTGVRADAVVRYAAPRLPAQQVPPQARVLQVTVADYESKPLLSLTITNRSRVRRIATIVDHLQFLRVNPAVAISCPILSPAPIDTFTFRQAPSGRVLATVSEPADTPATASPCFTTTLAIRGHREPRLLEGGTLLREAGAILGVRLTTSP